MCDIKPIKSKDDYLSALNILESLWSKQSSLDHDQLEVLSSLIDYYESTAYLFDFPDPIEALKFYVEQLDISLSVLDEIFGSPEATKAVLEKRTAITIENIREFCKHWKVPVESFIKPYNLLNEKSPCT